MPEKTIPVRFPNGRGQTLAARLEMPAGEPVAFALFAHCFTCSKDVKAASRISRGLRGNDVAVLRFDFTGLGSSEGDFANEDFSSNIADLVAAADWLRANHVAPSLLVGHSLGGAAVLVAADRIDEVRAVATIAAPSDPAHVKSLLGDGAETIEREGAAEVELAGRRFRIRRDFLDDLERFDLAASLRAGARPLLVFHAPADEIVGMEHARRLFDEAPDPKSLIALDGADHMLSDPRDSAYVASVLAAWAHRYLGAPEAREAKDGDVSGEPGVVRVEETGEGTFTQRVRVRGHALVADEPGSAGGDDRGPTPYDLLLAALGSCTAMTLRMYARHKEWPLEHVGVTLRHRRIHAKDCEDCETKEGKIDRIERELDVRGDLDDAQRARLVEIAGRCPVHRTLMSETKIDTRLADA